MRKKATGQKGNATAPHECVVLAIDAGGTSGHAILSRGRPTISGATRTALDRSAAVAVAMHLACEADLPLVVAMESWAGKFKSTATAIGIGAARGRWEQAIENAGYRLDHIVWLSVSTWRSRIGMGKQADSQAYKRAAIARVKAQFGMVVGPDEAEAILIGFVASMAPETGAMIQTISRSRKKAA